MDVLDQRKDEAIERTFKQVAANFEEVFERLVPAGRGRLIIQKGIDPEDDAGYEQDETQKTSIDNYTGISIKVRYSYENWVAQRTDIVGRFRSTPK